MTTQSKRKLIRLGGQVFKTKTSLQEYIRGIVAKYKDEQQLDMFDTAFVLALLEQHPQADTKIGAGVERIIVRRNPVYRRNRGFHLFRIDGTDTDFSWVECLTPTPHHKKVIRAMRVLVEPQTMAFKQQFFDNTAEPRCALTGEPIAFVGSHVDHMPPFTFEVLVQEFCDRCGINLESVPLRDEMADNKYVDLIDDDALAMSWVQFHKEHACLRVVSQIGNLSHAKRL